MSRASRLPAPGNKLMPDLLCADCANLSRYGFELGNTLPLLDQIQAIEFSD